MLDIIQCKKCTLILVDFFIDFDNKIPPKITHIFI